MRTLMAVVALLAGMASYAVLPAAEDKADQKERVLVVMVQDLNLTDSQETKIAEIRKECRSKVQEAAKELATAVKTEMEKIGAVLTPEQKTRLAAQREEREQYRVETLAEHIAHVEELDLTDAEVAKLAEIRKEFHPKVVKAMEGFRGILNDQQRQAREAGLKAGKTRREIMESFNLSADQKEKVQAVCKEVHTLVRDELEKMRDVLTESQKEKIQEFRDERKDRVRDRRAHMVANFKELNLTEEQRTKIHDIRKEFAPQVHEAGNKLRSLIREETEMILKVLKG
jgi:Spy/CpxP family protein refolding chaperone